MKQKGSPYFRSVFAFSFFPKSSQLSDNNEVRNFSTSVENDLSLNSGKTQAIIICRDRGRLSALLPAVLVDGRTENQR
jgi:hypothetical protein